MFMCSAQLLCNINVDMSDTDVQNREQTSNVNESEKQHRADGRGRLTINLLKNHP